LLRHKIGTDRLWPSFITALGALETAADKPLVTSMQVAARTLRDCF